MQDLLAKKSAIDDFIKNNTPRNIFSFSCRGIDGYILEKAKFMNKESILISHGTVAESYDMFDKIYKQIIADAVFSGEASYTSLQSKIAVNNLKNIYTLLTQCVQNMYVFSYYDKIQKVNQGSELFL
jgi:hypothetical protein